jgi:hypothetical protein
MHVPESGSLTLGLQLTKKAEDKPPQQARIIGHFIDLWSKAYNMQV